MKSGWTGSIPNISSSSRSPSASPSRPSPLNLKDNSETGQGEREMEAFGERFKYVICTSGLLEKVYVPCLGGPRKEEVVESPNSVEEGQLAVDGRLEAEDWKRDALEDVRVCVRKMRERPDITAAGIVLLVAVAWVVGWMVFIGLFVGISTVAGLLWRNRIARSVHPLPNAPPIETASAPVKEPNADTLSSLQDLMTASTSLDSTVDSALSIFQGHPDSSNSHHDLRLAIHRLTESMTDHLGSATSNLLELVDRTELGILGEMYDIPIGPGSGNRNRAQTISDDEMDLKALKRLSWNASKSLIPLSLPMGTSSSSPARLHPDRKHTVHLSLGGMPLEDRFTTVPKRTPRSIKRSSWAAEWNDRNADGIDLITLSERPTLKTIPSSSIELQNTSSDESGPWELPKTPNPQRDRSSVTPRRSSPLSRRDSDSSDTFQRHIFPIVPPTPAKYPLLPSPFRSPIRDDQKRRSLQTMPYFHSDKSDIASPGRASISGSSDMARTGSLQVSDLQMLRDQSTNGLIPSHSIESLASRAGFTPTRPRRIVNRTTRSPSLSPLTLPGLKAACLGVHMKRRRVACCLLGLKFDQGGEYWIEVKRVLDDLVVGINAAVNDLQVAEREARVIVKPRSTSISVPPWMTGNLSSSTRLDYAPRTSDHALLLQQIESMEATLHRTWNNLQAMRPAIDSPEDLAPSWASVRGDLGELIRGWERGKDIVSRLDASTHLTGERSEEGEEGDLEPMPAFLKAWEEEGDPSSTATDSVRSSVDTHDTFSSNPHDLSHFDPLAAEILPPPGQDMVFESIPMHIVPRAKAKMSREERIKAMKEGRENPPEQVKGVSEMGGDVVGELKSMIGIIRRRKGIPEAEPDPVAPLDATMGDERQKLPMGFADDLRKAFVFPPPHVDNQHSH
jgi:hypothetical protein